MAQAEVVTVSKGMFEFTGFTSQLVLRGEARAAEVIKPDPNRPVFVVPEDITSGRLEKGFKGKPVQRLILLNAAWIVGGGPLTQLTEVIEGMSAKCAEANIPIGYVGSALPVSTLESYPIRQVGVIPDANTVTEKYHASEQVLTDVLRQITQETDDTIIGVASVGYTGYGPAGVKRAIETVNRENPGRNMKAVVLNYDSSYPDTDKPSNEADVTNTPIDRFAPQAYQSTDEVIIYNAILNPLPLPSNIGSRAPKGSICVATSMPFSQESVSRLSQLQDADTEHVRSVIGRVLAEKGVDPKVSDMFSNQDVIFMPFIVSGDYYDASSIGKWMTEEQFRDVIDGTHGVVSALSALAKLTGRPVVTSGVKPFVELARQNPEVKDVADYSEDAAPALYIFQRPSLSREEHVAYMRASNITIHRTTQANSYAESGFAGALNLVVSMPRIGYMDAETMDRRLKQYGFLQAGGNIDPHCLARYVQKIAENTNGMRKNYLQRQNEFLNAVQDDPGRNFFGVLSHTLGL